MELQGDRTYVRMNEISRDFLIVWHVCSISSGGSRDHPSSVTFVPYNMLYCCFLLRLIRVFCTIDCGQLHFFQNKDYEGRCCRKLYRSCKEKRKVTQLACRHARFCSHSSRKRRKRANVFQIVLKLSGEWREESELSRFFCFSQMDMARFGASWNARVNELHRIISKSSEQKRLVFPGRFLKPSLSSSDVLEHVHFLQVFHRQRTERFYTRYGR